MYTLKIKAGATYRRVFRWTVSGVAVDLNGWSARSHIRRYYTDTVPTVSLTTDGGGAGGITLNSGGDGNIEYVITDTQTKIPWKTGVWDLELISPGGEVKRLLEGTVEVTPEVTQ